MIFRDRLLSSLRALRPVLEVEGVLVVGSEIPNLLEDGAASTLVVSEDVDVAIPVERHGEVKDRLRRIEGFSPSTDEPSVWLPVDEGMIEVNFIGLDRSLDDVTESYVFADDTLPLLVFGQLSLLAPGRVLEIEGARVPLPRPAGLMLEKLLTDRSGVKGDRDLLVVLGLLLTGTDRDLDELADLYRSLAPDLRHTVRSNLTVLSLLGAVAEMPDPEPHRARIARLLERLEAMEDEP